MAEKRLYRLEIVVSEDMISLYQDGLVSNHEKNQQRRFILAQPKSQHKAKLELTHTLSGGGCGSSKRVIAVHLPIQPTATPPIESSFRQDEDPVSFTGSTGTQGHEKSKVPLVVVEKRDDVTRDSQEIQRAKEHLQPITLPGASDLNEPLQQSMDQLPREEYIEENIKTGPSALTKAPTEIVITPHHDSLQAIPVHDEDMIVETQQPDFADFPAQRVVRKKWKKLAPRMMTLFMLEATVSDDHLNEIVHLSQAADKEISEKLITTICARLKDGPEEPTRLLSTLKTILSNTMKEHFNLLLLGFVLESLVDKTGSLIDSKRPRSNRLIEIIVPILNCLYVSGTTGIPKEKYEKYKKSFDQAWIGKVFKKQKADDEEGAENRAFQAKRALFVELLKRVGDGQYQLPKGAMISGNIKLGLFGAPRANMSFDVSSVIDERVDIESAVEDFDMKQRWFDIYFGFRLCLSFGVEKGSEYLDKLKLKSDAIDLSTAFLIVDCVFECFCATNEGAQRQQVFGLLNKLPTYKNWPSDVELGKYIGDIKSKMLHYKPKQIALTTFLFDKANRYSKEIDEVIGLIKNATLTDKEFNSRFANYVPCLAERALNKGESRDAVELLREFISPLNKRTNVLLILGDSGSGKSLLQQYMVRELWKQYETGNPIPLYAPLTAFKNPGENVIRELLSCPTKNSLSGHDLGLKEEHINLLMKEDQPFIFFLDSFDEIEHSSQSFYESNKLSNWHNSKFVIGYRSQYLSKIPGYQKLFSPLSHGGDPAPIDEIHILPFTPAQRIEFFKKYVGTNLESEWKEGILFEEHIQSIPNLAEFAVTPFTINFAAKNLPDIEKMYLQNQVKTDHIELMHTEFFRRFVDSWFQHEYDKHRDCQHSDFLEFPENFPSTVHSYCKKLANHMNKIQQFKLQYRWNVSQNASDNPELDEFFGNSPKWQHSVRRAAPIRRTSENTYEFVHESIRKLFADDLAVNQSVVQNEQIVTDNEPLCGSQNVLAIPAHNHKSEKDKETPADSYEKPQKKIEFKQGSKHQKEEIKESSSFIDPLNQTIAKPGLINLSREVPNDQKLQSQLLDILHISKDDGTKAQAAANAITILNYAGVSFAKMDLSGVQIPGADLSRSILDGADLSRSFLDGANFTGANLNNVSFVDACMNSCNFEEANMEGVKLGSCLKLMDHKCAISYVCNVNGPKGECWLASGSDDTTIRIWDIATDSEIKTLKGHAGVVNSVCSVNGPHGEFWLASGNNDGTIRIWDIATGSEIKTLNGHTNSVTSVCSVNGPDGECWLASGSKDNTIRLWDMKVGIVFKILQGRSNSIYSVCSVNGPNGECWLASGSSDKTIRIWDIASGSEIKTLNGHSSAVWIVCNVNVPKGKCWLASGSGDGTIRIWDITTDSEIKTLKGHAGVVNSVCSVAGPNGEFWLASGNNDGTIRIWSIYSNTNCANVANSLQSEALDFESTESVTLQTDPGRYHRKRNSKEIVTRFICGTQKLECRDSEFYNTKGLSLLNKFILLQEGAVTFDDFFVQYTQNQKYTEFQALRMADCYSKGWGTEKDMKKSWGWTARAGNFEKVKQEAEKGMPDAFNVLVELAYELSYSKDATYLELARMIADCYAKGWGTEKDMKKSWGWIARAGDFEKIKEEAEKIKEEAEIGMSDAFNVLVELAYELSYSKDATYLELARMIADCYAKGWGTEKDMKRSWEWTARAGNFEKVKQEAEKGMPDAFNVLVELAYELSYSKDATYLELARMIADCYAKGWGTEKDVKRSWEWTARAGNFEKVKQEAEKGMSDAFNVLVELAYELSYVKDSTYPKIAKIISECYDKGWGTEKDVKKSWEWTSRAGDFEKVKEEAEKGMPDAFNVLVELADELSCSKDATYLELARMIADCYAKGWGTKKDMKESWDWFIRALHFEWANRQARISLEDATRVGKTSQESKKASTDNKYAEVCRMIARCYAEGWGIDNDEEKLNHWNSKANEFEGSKQKAKTESKDAVDNPMKSKNTKEDREASKCPEVSRMIVECYAEGWGTDQNHRKSLEWIIKLMSWTEPVEPIALSSENKVVSASVPEKS